jgi:hypothetical protein
LAVTWSGGGPAHLEDAARRIANTWKVPLYERPRKSGLTPHFGVIAHAFLVCDGRGVRLVSRSAELRVSPGLALLRLKRLAVEASMVDALVHHAKLRQGERVIDGTLGLGADARVMASRLGARGTVIGVEASLPLAVLMSEGLPFERPWPDSAPIEVVHSTALGYLSRQPTASADVVFFDPMFERRKAASPAFEQLRSFASVLEIDPDAVRQATRVARRLVLMKSDDPRVFPQLGLKPLPPLARNSTVYWGQVGIEKP